MATATEYQRSVPVGRLTNRDVIDYTGHKIGDLDEVVLDMTTGCLDFAVVSFGGFLGIGEKHYLIPSQALHYDPEQGTFRMDVTRDQVEKAPGFTGTEWPNFNDETYMQSVFGYWGATRQPAQWQRPWDAQWRQQHPEMYSQGQQQAGMYGENTSTAPYAGTGMGESTGPGAGQQQMPVTGQGYTTAPYTGPERRQSQFGRRTTDYQG